MVPQTADTLPHMGAISGQVYFISHEHRVRLKCTIRKRPTAAQFFAADSCRFEQAFSGDGGKTWEVNWIATDVRIK